MNSSLQWSSTTCEGASSSQNQSLSSSSVNSSIQRREKKRVSFADVCGKDLFTVRTMSEPSNCPPKLTSKIVQYFLNREFNYGNQLTDYSYGQNSYHSGDYYASRLQRRDSFFSTSRSYDYGKLKYWNKWIWKMGGLIGKKKKSFQKRPNFLSQKWFIYFGKDWNNPSISIDLRP